ncbi:MAG: AtpZ/AtpI family protein [Lachnospiraceae bacterium]|nr:AtpZ/AtpI family protein [Lachnospiraceae bacterium]
MKRNEWSKTVQNLVWIGQLGLSVALPLGVFVFLAVYLKNRFDLGAWVIIVGVLLGLYGSVGSFISTLKMMKRTSESKDEEKKGPPVSFQDHD